MKNKKNIIENLLITLPISISLSVYLFLTMPRELDFRNGCAACLAAKIEYPEAEIILFLIILGTILEIILLLFVTLVRIIFTKLFKINEN